MLCIASVITFSVFLESLRKSTLLVHYKLSRFWTREMNHFDICALLFVGYTRFIPFYKMVLYGLWKSTLWKFIDVTVSFDIVSIV